MICFSSFVVLIIEMELETFKITVLPLQQKMLNFSQRLVEDTADAEDVVQRGGAGYAGYEKSLIG